MTIIEQIKAEIERRIRSIENCPFIEAELGASEKRDGKLIAYKDLLSFISTIESGKPMQEGLEDEIKSYADYCEFDFKSWDYDTLDAIARHFAHWGAEHRGSSEIPKDLDEAAEKYQDDHTIQRYAGGRLLAPEFDVTVKEVFIAGAKWMAEQIKK